MARDEGAPARLASLAVTLRERSPWEALDLGLAMLRQWWRPAYAAHALVLGAMVAALLALGWALDAAWLALILLWWCKPLYDRAVLHVLSQAVFGEAPSPRAVLAAASAWLKSGLLAALTLERFDLARSFNLPVRQLEGQHGREARARRRILGQRARSYAVWLTVVWVHFEAVLLWSAGALADLLLPAQLERAGGANHAVFGLFDAVRMITAQDLLLYAAVVFILEPFYVAAGFALYLNRRTLLEGWDIEVALRRLAARHGTALVLLLAAALVIATPTRSLASDQSPKQEVAEVLKAPEFGHFREKLRWVRRAPAPERAQLEWRTPPFGVLFAEAARALIWILLAGAVLYALWWLAQRLPAYRTEPRVPDQPPESLFGLDICPERLPPDVAAAAATLAGEGRMRDALGLLYRAVLSDLVHKRGLPLLVSHTEGEALELAGNAYFAALIEAWRLCAYAQREPSREAVLRLVAQYREEAFA